MSLPQLRENLKHLRVLRGYTQGSLAKKVFKASVTTIGHWEQGRVVPNLPDLVLLSALYGVSIDDLVRNDLTKSVKLSKKPHEK